MTIRDGMHGDVGQRVSDRDGKLFQPVASPPSIPHSVPLWRELVMPEVFPGLAVRISAHSSNLRMGGVKFSW